MNQKQKRAVNGPAKGETMNLFISSDIEGTCGICDWSEISENLSLSFEQIFNPSSYMDVKDVLKEAADAQ